MRRDLRLEDNVGLYRVLELDLPVLVLFIFDDNISDTLPHDDSRIQFIYDSLSNVNKKLSRYNSSLYIRQGDPLIVWQELITRFDIDTVIYNEDYEPYSIQRDQDINTLLAQFNIKYFAFQDHTIASPTDILKPDGRPYTIYTPYKNKWLITFREHLSPLNPPKKFHFLNHLFEFPKLEQLGFKKSSIQVPAIDLSAISSTYISVREFPYQNATSHLGPHLRFGTISVRQVFLIAIQQSESFLSELIWREFFIQILYHFPHVVTQCFKSNYENIQWINNEKQYQLWCEGKTGYPLVDAGIRQLVQSGTMHNRVRMLTASFLCKHLLIDWRWGEAFFAQHLLDYELSSNNGNWQWCAGCGCDAAPYFRIFNPITQQEKYDPQMDYIRQWLPEWGSSLYPTPIINHAFARLRAIEIYKKGIRNT